MGCVSSNVVADAKDKETIQNNDDGDNMSRCLNFESSFTKRFSAFKNNNISSLFTTPNLNNCRRKISSRETSLDKVFKKLNDYAKAQERKQQLSHSQDSSFGSLSSLSSLDNSILLHTRDISANSSEHFGVGENFMKSREQQLQQSQNLQNSFRSLCSSSLSDNDLMLRTQDISNHNSFKSCSSTTCDNSFLLEAQDINDNSSDAQKNEIENSLHEMDLRNLEMELYMKTVATDLMPKASSPVSPRFCILNDPSYSDDYLTWCHEFENTPTYMFQTIKNIPEAISGQFCPHYFPAYSNIANVPTARTTMHVDNEHISRAEIQFTNPIKRDLIDSFEQPRQQLELDSFNSTAADSFQYNSHNLDIEKGNRLSDSPQNLKMEMNLMGKSKSVMPKTSSPKRGRCLVTNARAESKCYANYCQECNSTPYTKTSKTAAIQVNIPTTITTKASVTSATDCHVLSCESESLIDSFENSREHSPSRDYGYVSKSSSSSSPIKVNPAYVKNSCITLKEVLEMEDENFADSFDDPIQQLHESPSKDFGYTKKSLLNASTFGDSILQNSQEISDNAPDVRDHNFNVSLLIMELQKKMNKMAKSDVITPRISLQTCQKHLVTNSDSYSNCYHRYETPTMAISEQFGPYNCSSATNQTNVQSMGKSKNPYLSANHIISTEL